jgi:hypothetical protein
LQADSLSRVSLLRSAPATDHGHHALRPRNSVRRLTPSALAVSSALRPSLFINLRFKFGRPIHRDAKIGACPAPRHAMYVRRETIAPQTQLYLRLFGARLAALRPFGGAPVESAGCDPVPRHVQGRHEQQAKAAVVATAAAQDPHDLARAELSNLREAQ